MDSDQLFSIWEKGNETRLKDHKISKDMITQILNQKTQKTLRHFYFNLMFYWIIQLISLVLISMNFVGYKENPTILWVIGVQMIIILGVIIYGVFVLIRFREINNYSKDLKSLIELNIQFFKTHYEAWILLIAFTLLILIFNLNIFVDNMDGHYLINKVGVFVGTNIAVFLLIYGTQKIASERKYKTLKANLHDLNTGILDESIKMEHTKRRYVWIYILIAIVLVVVFVIGLIKALQF